MKSAFIFFLLINFFSSYSQSNTVSSGGTATGTGGTLSYSVGEIFISPSTGSNGTLSPGLQQPLEIYVITGIRNFEIDLDAKIYPNPFVQQLHISINNINLKKISYNLIDINGRILRTGNISKSTTTIDLPEFQVGTYLLKFFYDTKEYKVYKIVKAK